MTFFYSNRKARMNISKDRRKTGQNQSLNRNNAFIRPRDISSNQCKRKNKFKLKISLCYIKNIKR